MRMRMHVGVQAKKAGKFTLLCITLDFSERFEFCSVYDTSDTFNTLLVET